PSSVPLRRRQSSILAAEQFNAPESEASLNITRRSASAYGSGFHNTPFTIVNMAVLTPIPSATVSAANRAKPGRRSSVRSEKSKSASMGIWTRDAARRLAVHGDMLFEEKFS